MRLRLGFAHEMENWGVGAYGLGTRAPGWRDSSGVDEAKLNLLADGEVGGGTLRLRAAGTVLNQETAGFIQGYNSYRDEDIAESNPNPEAFRDASSARVSAQYERDNCFSRDCRFELAGIYRRSSMDFIQHFLIGKPFEHNAQTSFMVSSTLGMDFFSNLLDARITVDAEIADSELTQFQPGPATDGAPPANAIRPAGLQYDYTVDSNTIGTTLALDWRFAESWSLAAALRVDRTQYDYDNLHDRWQHRRRRHALPRGQRLSVRAARGSHRHLRQRGAAHHVVLATRRTLAAVPERFDRLSAARDDRVVSPAATADLGRSRQRTTRLARGRLEIPGRNLLAEHRAVRHGEEQRDPARIQWLLREQRQHDASRRSNTTRASR